MSAGDHLGAYEWATVVLKAAETCQQLAEGVLYRKPGVDRAARMTLLRAANYMAFVADALRAGYLTQDEGGELRARCAAFNIDHGPLIELHEARMVMEDLLRSGTMSPFANMGEPAKWPAEIERDELRDALGGMLHAFGAGHTDDPEKQAALGRAKRAYLAGNAALAKARGEA